MSETLTPILTLDDWIESFIHQSRWANKLDIMRYLNYDVGQDATLAEVDAALWQLHEADSIHVLPGIWDYRTRDNKPNRWSGRNKWASGAEGRRQRLDFRARHFPTTEKTDHSNLEVEDWILTLLRAQEATRSRKNPRGTFLTAFGPGGAVSAVSLMSAIQYQAGHDVTIAQFDSAVDNLITQGKIDSMHSNRNSWRIILLDDDQTTVKSAPAMDVV